MAFSRDQPLMPEVVDLPGAIEHTVQSLFRTLTAEMEIVTRYDGAIDRALIDGQYLENALLNLVLNARDAMNGSGVVTIVVENHDRSKADPIPGLPQGEFVKVAVSDTGEGMTPDVLDQAMQPFFTTKTAGSGTGLGLSMVYRFVKQSGGHIEIESRPGQGTTVSMYLPRADGDSIRDGEPEGALPDFAFDDFSILVTEDDEPVRRATVKLLQEQGMRTFEAANADEAIAILAGEPAIDLLFSDVHLRGSISGYELAAKAKELRPDLKVAFCSGNASRPDPNSKVAGAPLLRKPYTPDALRRTVAQVLAAGNSGAGPLN
jgi:CheY-like chemotaxis protein